jgi:hypothetical protein
MNRATPRCVDGTRRRLLLCALAAGSGVSWLLPGPATRFARCVRQLLRADRRADAATALARAVVFGDPRCASTVDHWSDSQLRRTIRANIAADYRSGRIVNQAGWRVAVTEAQALELMTSLRLAG